MDGMIQIQGVSCGLGACLQCIGEYKLFMDNIENVANEAPPPPIYFAVTIAPSWQTQQIGPQMVVACVSAPTCLGHLGVAPITPRQQAAKSGLIIPGSGM